jgi:transposase
VSVVGAKRRYYDDEFKQAAIRLVTVNGHGVSETARNLGINANMLGRWKREEETKQDDTSPDAGLSSQEKEELSQLRSEVKRLRMEREILKKAAQFFANESN